MRPLARTEYDLSRLLKAWLSSRLVGWLHADQSPARINFAATIDLSLAPDTSNRRPPQSLTASPGLVGGDGFDGEVVVMALVRKWWLWLID